MPAHSPWRFCIAPMLDWTDTHYRVLARLMTRHARLYTEMVTTGALLHGDVPRHLAFDDREQPVALQLGGSDPAALAACARMGQEFGYNEINLNVGCPSDRVQNGAFGACLMASPAVVADAVAAMAAAVSVPVTVKTRVGIDRDDSYEAFARFVDTVRGGGCSVFIIHARKAWLDGLSPKENREVPPLRWDFVRRIQADFPDLVFVLNGKLHTLPQMAEQLDTFPGVMVGRAAYEHIDWLRAVDHALFDPQAGVPSRTAVLTAYHEYMAAQMALGVPLPRLVKPLLTLFNGLPGARQFRRHLSEQAPRRPKDVAVFEEALAFLPNLESTASAEWAYRLHENPGVPLR